jgi:predicted dehydrogenase
MVATLQSLSDRDQLGSRATRFTIVGLVTRYDRLSERHTKIGRRKTQNQTSGDSIRLDVAANYQASYRAARTHFLDRLDDGAPFETSAEDNLATLEIAEAAYARGFLAQ